METAIIVKLVLMAADMARTLGPLAEKAIAIANSNDEAQIKAALKDLQAANDVLFDKVQKQLRG